MKQFIKCGKLFTGNAMANGPGDQYLVVEGDSITHVGSLSPGLQPGPGDTVTDYSRFFVAPGLIDIHVHLSYGNAKTEEDIDLYASVEFRALRGLEAAQKVLKAGYTSIADPATTSLVTPRDSRRDRRRSVRGPENNHVGTPDHRAPGFVGLVSAMGRSAEYLDRSAGAQRR